MTTKEFGLLKLRPIRQAQGRQIRVLEFIGRFLEDKGYPPTIRDIMLGCGLSSSVVSSNLNILEREGYIRRVPGIARGIIVVKTLKGMTTNTDTRPACGKCGSRVIYVRIDGSIVCRRCGAITKPNS